MLYCLPSPSDGQNHTELSPTPPWVELTVVDADPLEDELSRIHGVHWGRLVQSALVHMSGQLPGVWTDQEDGLLQSELLYAALDNAHA